MKPTEPGLHAGLMLFHGDRVDSHVAELAGNTNVDADGHHHPTWVQIGGVWNKNASSWLGAICDALPKDVPHPLVCAQ